MKFWRERVVGVIFAQLVQGVTPQKIALTIALGISLGIFPILGATTALCGLAGFCLKLNQPVIQMLNWLVSPLQLSLILVFVRMGESLLRVPQISFSVPELIRKFNESPREFFHQFGMTGLHGIVAWLLIAPFLTALIYMAIKPLLAKIAPVGSAESPSRYAK